MVQRANAIEEPRWTHSLQLRLLAHTGIVGALLFLAALAAAGWSVVRRRASRAESGARAAAVAPLLVWLVHGSVDWLWEFPGLSIPALAFAGAATAVGAPRASARAFPRVVRPAAVVLAVLTAAAIVPAYLAEREVSTAAQTWPTEPGTARARLDRAERLAPLDARPLLVGAIIAQRSADLPAARRLFRKAADREPLDWFSRFELGLVAGVQGDRRYAARALRESRRLNPRDPVVRTALDRLRRGRPMSFAEAERAFTTRVQRRLGRDPDGVR
jgi:hypothetical protein